MTNHIIFKTAFECVGLPSLKLKAHNVLGALMNYLDESEVDPSNIDFVSHLRDATHYVVTGPAISDRVFFQVKPVGGAK